MSGKGDKRRKHDKEADERYLNNKFWFNDKKEKDKPLDQ